MRTRCPALVMLLALVAATGCSGDTYVDASGSYTLNVTNGDNGCGFQGWTVGEQASNVPLVITQDGAMITGTLEGVVGLYVNSTLGSRTFSGEVSGEHLVMTLHGTRTVNTGNCVSTIDATADARLDGDFLEGKIVYTYDTNGSPDCATIEGCETRQTFNGSRPPAP